MQTPTHTQPPADSPKRLPTVPEPAQHILVLVPSLTPDLTDATRKLWQLARTSGAHIQFVCLYGDPAQEPGLRRGLTTLAASVQDAGITTAIAALPGRNWMDIVNTHPADMLVCFPEMKAHTLNQLAQMNPPVPLYILSAPAEEPPAASDRSARLAAWAGSLAILASFIFIQARLIQLSPNWLHPFLLVLSTLAEFGSIWSFNSYL